MGAVWLQLSLTRCKRREKFEVEGLFGDLQAGQADGTSAFPAIRIFLLTNMIYADILSLIDATSPIRKIMAGASTPAGGLLAGAGDGRKP